MLLVRQDNLAQQALQVHLDQVAALDNRDLQGKQELLDSQEILVRQVLQAPLDPLVTQAHLVFPGHLEARVPRVVQDQQGQQARQDRLDYPVSLDLLVHRAPPDQLVCLERQEPQVQRVSLVLLAE